MSGNTNPTPPPPAMLPAPKRGVRRLNSRPVVLGTVFILAIVGGVFWVFTSIKDDITKPPEQDALQPGKFEPAVYNPMGNMLNRPRHESAPPVPPVQAKPAALATPKPKETSAEAQIRKLAWERYAQNLQEAERFRSQQVMDAYKGDPTGAATQGSEQGQPAYGQNGQGPQQVVPGVNGPVSGGGVGGS